MSRAVLTALCLSLTGCFWWGGDDAPLPQPATDSGLSSAESRLDHLTDKRDSRVAAAIDTAAQVSSEKPVKDELAVARAMLPEPTKADLAYAKARADKGDDAFYAEQLKVSRDLAAALLRANDDYEREKSRKQAEYESRLKEKEMALAAEQEARQADKWTYAGIGLVTIGLLGLFLSPLKAACAGIAATGLVVGAFPILSKQPWFAPALGATVVLGAILAVILNRRKAPAADAQTPPQG